MDTTVNKFRWFWAWQDEAEEEWLGKMSAKGLHLIAPGFPAIYTFKVGEPKEYVYRLDYQSFHRKDREEYLQLFRDAGWEHLGQMASWQYFRKEAVKGGTNEIFTDTESKTAKYKRVLAYVGFFYIMFGVILWSRLAAYSAYGWKDAITWLMLIMLVFFTYALIKLGMRIIKLGKR